MNVFIQGAIPSIDDEPEIPQGATGNQVTGAGGYYFAFFYANISWDMIKMI
jgi:hypothetical protein